MAISGSQCLLVSLVLVCMCLCDYSAIPLSAWPILSPIFFLLLLSLSVAPSEGESSDDRSLIPFIDIVKGLVGVGWWG